jgi:hypothetical protein
MVDEDRSELDDRDVAVRVLEHAQATDPTLGAWLVRGDLDGLARRIDLLRSEAPFAPPLPYATTPQGAILRRYLAAFGIDTPPREDGERERTDASIGVALERIAGERDRPSAVYIWAPPPLRKDLMKKAVRLLSSRRIPLHWTLPRIEDSVGVPSGTSKSREDRVRETIEDAVRIRARVDRIRGAEILRAMGAKVLWHPLARPLAHEQPRARGDV